ncbi:unnamed protein product [Polarella glacialis]|uniref:TLC domain-containing protein n=1 Tax=Polarella glacialis TaxID=89957 RepID=A0A813GGP9_POLGL|nr:unnamed protein product [Polarella glacialis]
MNFLEESDEFGPLLSGPAVVGCCLLWTCLWLCSHLVLPSSGETPAERFYIRKLRRMKVFCLAATTSGVAVFAKACLHQQEPVREMLVTFGPAQQVLFSMAVGHWTVNLYEDWRTREFLAVGLTDKAGNGLALFPLNLCFTAQQIMYLMYIIHHLVTIAAYCFSLATWKLGGVMVQGLMFEIPVILMLRRELAVAQAEPPRWLSSPRDVRRHWWLQYAAFVLGRGPAEVLWVVAMVPGYTEDQLQRHLGSVSGLAVFHVLGVFFTALNLRILGLYFCWHAQDAARAKHLEQRPAPDRCESVALPEAPPEQVFPKE